MHTRTTNNPQVRLIARSDQLSFSSSRLGSSCYSSTSLPSPPRSSRCTPATLSGDTNTHPSGTTGAPTHVHGTPGGLLLPQQQGGPAQCPIRSSGGPPSPDVHHPSFGRSPRRIDARPLTVGPLYYPGPSARNFMDVYLPTDGDITRRRPVVGLHSPNPECLGAPLFDPLFM